MSIAIAVMARYPFGTEVKTRLSASLDAAARAVLYRAFLADTLRQVESVPNIVRTVVYTPPEACAWFRQFAGASWQLVAQRDAAFGARVAGALEDVLAVHSHVLLVGSDAPNVPRAYLERGACALERGVDVVIGPAADGGYYCIGLRRAQPGLFERVEWSTERTRAQTQAAAAARGLQVELLPEWYDVDVAADLDRLMHDLSGDHTAAPHTWQLLCSSTAHQGLASFGQRERK
jgi:rSAM/selenodomain-associated transferase 1